MLHDLSLMSEPAERLSPADVQRYLQPHGITVQELQADTSTAPLAARAVGCAVGAIVKSLLFLADSEPLLVLAAGDRKIDTRLLGREVGARKVRFAPADTALDVTGYTVGGVPPVAHRRPLRTVMDRHLLQQPLVYAAAGASNALFPIEPQRLQTLTGAALTDAAT